LEQLSGEGDKQFAKDTYSRIAAINKKRQDVIHASFEPVESGVQFRRIVPQNVSVDNPVWREQDFDEQCTKMKEAEAALNKLISMIKPLPPMDWHPSFQEMYQPRHSAVAAYYLMSGTVDPPQPP
jgi:hypothetical protein